MGFGTAHCASKGGRGEAQGDAESKKGEGARHTTHKVGVGGCVGGEESLHTGARPPKDGTGSESSPNSGIAANGVGTAMIALREAFINSGKDGHRGIDEEGRAYDFETGDQPVRRGQDRHSPSSRNMLGLVPKNPKPYQ